MHDLYEVVQCTVCHTTVFIVLQTGMRTVDQKLQINLVWPITIASVYT